MGNQRVHYDDQAKAACKAVVARFEDVRREIIQHSQFRRNSAVSPTDPNWGKPNPLDIAGLIEQAFSSGIMYANQVNKVEEK